MKTLSIREAPQALSHLERLLEEEGELTITRRGEAIAQVLPIDKKRTIPSHRNLRKSMSPMPSRRQKLVRKDRDAR
jgi:antitoxin (DNA-binding transcriptional repressor) of toxin-antitoxin stability system